MIPCVTSCFFMTVANFCRLWFYRESNVQVESMVGEVMEQMLQEMSSTEIRLEEERVAEEKRKLEEARLVDRGQMRSLLKPEL